MTRKISISLPDWLDEAARTAAEVEGLPVSSWLARAAQQALAERAILVDGRAAILEEIADQGPIAGSADDQAWVDGVLRGARSSPARHAS